MAAPKTAKAKAPEAEGSDELPAVLSTGPVVDPKLYRVLSPVQVSGRRRFEVDALLTGSEVSDEEAEGLVKLGALEEVAP